MRLPSARLVNPYRSLGATYDYTSPSHFPRFFPFPRVTRVGSRSIPNEQFPWIETACLTS
uniref:Uncharacterized protein n=1 Tax=Picea glauca TaxID=3330 RepID=A0A117NFI0_PICGL|nr:hypothetical protein ABT39_MTgene3487 [Picea glauca]